ncbi:diguanylate cyclase, partial [Vibrio parahaemolyticus]|nr:diguanylate cyclase [Vibrio parahaemolyticus]
ENNVENTAQEALHQLAYTGREYSNIQDQIETISDLLGHSQSLYEYLRQPNRVNRSILEDMWISVAINQKLYKQIRFLDVSGREKVRINYEIETGAALPAIKLQNKSERDYFQFAKNLDDGEIASWGIGLEREYGELVYPYSPSLRILMPISLNGKREGYLVLNVDIDYLSSRLNYSSVLDFHIELI